MNKADATFLSDIIRGYRILSWQERLFKAMIGGDTPNHWTSSHIIDKLQYVGLSDIEICVIRNAAISAAKEATGTMLEKHCEKMNEWGLSVEHRCGRSEQNFQLHAMFFNVGESIRDECDCLYWELFNRKLEELEINI